MAIKAQDAYLGRICLRKGLISEDELEKCLAEQAGSEMDLSLEEVLLDHGFVTRTQLKRLGIGTANEQVLAEDALLGQILIRCGLIGEEQLDQCLEEQSRLSSGGRLGKVLIDRGFLDARGLIRGLAAQNKTIMLCPQCNNCYNVVGAKKGDEVLCMHCSHLLYIAEEASVEVAGTVYFDPEKLAQSARTGIDAGTSEMPPAEFKEVPEEEIIDEQDVEIISKSTVFEIGELDDIVEAAETEIPPTKVEKEPPRPSKEERRQQEVYQSFRELVLSAKSTFHRAQKTTNPAKRRQLYSRAQADIDSILRTFSKEHIPKTEIGEVESMLGQILVTIGDRRRGYDFICRGCLSGASPKESVGDSRAIRYRCIPAEGRPLR